MKFIFTCGGTGGHVSPALAIAEEIRKKSENAQILFICRAGGNESFPVQKLGYDVKFLDVQGIERRISPKNLRSIVLALSAEIKTRKIISDFKPDAVIGTGGYVCWPVLHAASAMGIPTLLHESNSVPGLVTRLLSKRVSTLAVSSEECKKQLKCKDNVKVLGNPVSERFFKASRKSSRERLKIRDGEVYILSFGGSGGAQKVNDVICEVIKSYSSKTPNVKHTHACGARYFKDYEGVKFKNCNVIPYIENMPERLAAADIVICRCGAMTLSEICATGAAAILIPSPNVTNNHQYRNGLALKQRGAAVMIEEKDLTESSLKAAIDELIRDENKRKTLIFATKNCADSKSSERIAKEIITLTKQGRST